MMPEIVRAAAEPMANIDNLTVLSNDGASDIVRNVTRTVTEANATVKGLTGIDIPALVSMPSAARSRRRAVGRDDTARPRRHGRRHRRPGVVAGRPVAPKPSTGTGGPAASASTRRRARRPRRPCRPAHGAATRGATPRPPPGRHTGRGRRRDGGRRGGDPGADRDPGSAHRHRRRARPPGRQRAPGDADISRETTVVDAATRLASDLRAVPGIERFAAVRLADLENAGPRPLRTMWRISREQLDERYGQLTIGELIDRYAGGARPPA